MLSGRTVRVVITLSLLCPAVTSLPVVARQNVLLLVSDNQSWPDCGCYGNAQVKTPHIDGLASEGVLFNYGFATTASCGPSRAVIYTGLLTPANGQYGHGHGVHTFRLNPRVKTVYHLLQERGYHTALLGKQHTTPAEQYPLTFERNISGRDVMKLADAGGEFIREAQAADKPFFLTIGYSDPHPTSRDGVGWGIRNEYKGVRPVTYDPAAVRLPAYLPDRPWVREGVAGYYQLISRMDAGVGRILEILRETGADKDTLVIFTSDHGSSEPGAMANHYEPGIRVPFIVRAPMSSAISGSTDAMVTLADITPTILDWAGVDTAKQKLDGHSFLPVLKGSDKGRDEVFLSHVMHEVTMYYPMRTLRTRRHKLIWNIAWRVEFPNPIDTLSRRTWTRTMANRETMIGRRTVQNFLFRDELELYDLQNDPDEINNLAAAPEHRQELTALLARLQQRCQATADPWLDRHTLPAADSFGRH